MTDQGHFFFIYNIMGHMGHDVTSYSNSHVKNTLEGNEDVFVRLKHFGKWAEQEKEYID